MRRVRKHPVLDETEQLRGRVAQLEKEKQDLLAQLAEAKRAAPPKPASTPPRNASESLRSVSGAFSALATAFGGSNDAARLFVHALPSRALVSGGLLDEVEQFERQAAQARVRGGPVEMEVRPGRTDYRITTRQVPVYMRVTFGLPRNEAALHGEVLIPMEQFHDDGTDAATRAVEMLSHHVIRTIRESDRTSNSFSRF